MTAKLVVVAQRLFAEVEDVGVVSQLAQPLERWMP